MKLPALRISAPAVIAVLALVIAVSSTSAYAATIITSKMIKNGTIQNIDVRNSTLTGAKVKDRSLTKADLAAGTIPAPYGGVKGYATDNFNPIILDGTGTSVSYLYIPQAGHYIASAVTMASNDGPVESKVTCTLTGDGTTDEKEVFVEKGTGDSPNRAVLSLQLADDFEAPGEFRLTCKRLFSENVSVRTTRISAIKLDSLQIQD